MSDSAATSAAASGNGGDSSSLNLVQADLDDFVAGGELFVRGRPAVCVRFEYPHVFWQWQDEVERAAACADGSYEAAEKHRSCSATPHLFRVRAEAKRSHGAGADSDSRHGDQHSGHDNSDDDDEAHSDMAQRRADAFAEQQRQQAETDQQQQSEQKQEQQQDAEAEADAAPDAVAGATARLSLMSLFSQRPQKSVIGHLRDGGDETISIAAPQSASIEKCVRTRFSVPNKVSQLTLLECEDVEVDFRGVISTVELIRCRRCTLRCLHSCATYTLDDSSDCVIQFPGVQERVLVVSDQGSARTVLLAQPGGGAALDGAATSGSDAAAESDEKQPADIDTEVRYVIGENAVEVEDTPAPEPSDSASLSIPADDAGQEQSPPAASASSPASAAPKQLQTVWKDGAFSTRPLVRQGPLGYFTN